MAGTQKTDKLIRAYIIDNKRRAALFPERSVSIILKKEPTELKTSWFFMAGAEGLILRPSTGLRSGGSEAPRGLIHYRLFESFFPNLK